MVEVYAVDLNLEKVKHYIFSLCLCFVYKMNDISMLTFFFYHTFIVTFTLTFLGLLIIEL